MKRLAAIAVLVSVAFGTPVVSLQNPATPQQAAPVQANLVILGRVLEAGTTTGVAGAVVVLTGGTLGTSGTGPRRVVADRLGQFVFRDLVPEVYTLNSTADGYMYGVYGRTRVVQIARGVDGGRPLELTGSDKVVNVSIQMWRTGGISGRVSDELGEPLVNVPITILARPTDLGRPMATVMTTPSDDRGMYHVDVIPGDYVVGVQAATTTVPASAVQGFLQAQALGGTDFQQYMQQVVARGSLLPRGYGSRIGDFVVSQFGGRNSPVVPPFRSDDGKQWFFPSTYHRSSVTAPGAQIVAVAPGEEKSGIDIVMRPLVASRVSGRLEGPNGPGSGFAVRLVPDLPSGRMIRPALMDTPQAMADDNGNFAFIGVAPGTYTVLAMANRWNSPSPMLWAAESVTVGDSDLEDLVIRLQSGSQITGRLVLEGGPPPSFQNLRSISLEPRPVAGSAAALVAGGGVGELSLLIAEGTEGPLRFTTGQYAPGPYLTRVNGLPGDWVLKSVTSGGQDALDRAFQLGPSGVADLVVTISNRISMVTGLARDAEGKAVATSVVVVFPTDKALWRLPGMESQRMVATAPDRSGRFTFRGLPAGDYFIVAADSPSQDFSDSTVLSTLIQHAQRFTLAEGESRTLDIRVVVMK